MCARVAAGGRLASAALTRCDSWMLRVSIRPWPFSGLVVYRGKKRPVLGAKEPAYRLLVILDGEDAICAFVLDHKASDFRRVQRICGDHCGAQVQWRQQARRFRKKLVGLLAHRQLR